MSELTPREETELRVTLEAIGAEQFQCARCLSQYRGRPDEEKLLATQLKTKACETPSDKPLFRVSDSSGEILFNRCPGNYVRSYFLALIAAYDAFERGVTYQPGSYGEQSEKLMQCFDAIGRWKAERARAASEAAAKKARGSKLNGR